jgi:hypothetical protein
MAVTTNGVPYQEASDPPDGATLGYGIATWLEGALDGGSTGQVLEQNQSVGNKLGWRWPHARVAAPTPTGTRGDLWVPSSGSDAGVLHWHDGSQWVKAQNAVNTAQWPLGRVVQVTKATMQTITTDGDWVDLTDLSTTQTLSVTRLYEVTVGVMVQFGRNDSAPTAQAFGLGRVMYGTLDVGRFLWHSGRAIPSGESDSVFACATTRTFQGTGSSQTIKAQVMRGTAALMSAGGGGTFEPAYLVVKDVGPAA